VIINFDKTTASINLQLVLKTRILYKIIYEK